MKFFISIPIRRRRSGSSLVEVALSIGLFSFGFISLAPLLALGLNAARHGKDERLTAQIAQALVEEAKQGDLTAASGPAYFDFTGAPCAKAQAAYTAQASFAPFAANGAEPDADAALQQLTLRVTPRGAPDHARVYAVVLPVAP